MTSPWRARRGCRATTPAGDSDGPATGRDLSPVLRGRWLALRAPILRRQPTSLQAWFDCGVEHRGRGLHVAFVDADGRALTRMATRVHALDRVLPGLSWGAPIGPGEV